MNFKTKILQIGEKNWKDIIEIPELLDWEFSTCEEIIQYIDEEKKKIEEINKIYENMVNPPEIENLEKRKYDVILFTTFNNEIPLKEMATWVQNYRIFIDEKIKYKIDESNLKHLIDVKLAKFINLEDKQSFIRDLRDNYYSRPYGQRIENVNIEISDNYIGEILYKGNDKIILDIDFEEEFTQILSYRSFPFTDPNIGLDVWIEYQKEGDIEIQLVNHVFNNQSPEKSPEIKVYSEEDLKEYIYMPPKETRNISSITLMAKGKGRLTISNLHMRHSRNGRGEFIPGGKRFVGENRQEFIYYFSPGNLKPPLNVYFSGYRTQEGFEGMFMMEKMKHPYILIADPRLEGGNFYIGDEKFENAICDVILKYTEKLGFTKDDLILSGLSMGTYGALYYGSKVLPHAIIVGKPLTNLGDIARNVKFIRPNEFLTSLDIVRTPLESSYDEEWFDYMNNRIFESFEKADFTNTTIAMAYMIHDDYDPKSFMQIVEKLKDKNVHIIGKGYPGRHNDNSEIINQWFLRQYDRIIKEDFNEENLDG